LIILTVDPPRDDHQANCSASPPP